MSETVRERKAVMLLRPRLPRFATASSRTREDGPAATRHSRGDPSRKEIKEKEKREYIGSTELGYRNARQNDRKRCQGPESDTVEELQKKKNM